MHEARTNIDAKPPPVAQEAVDDRVGTNIPFGSSIPPCPFFVKNIPDELRALAQAAHDAGDRATYWALRRRFLLA